MAHVQPRPAETVRPYEPAVPRTNLVVAVLAFGGIVVSLMQTLVIPIVPRLPALLHAPASNAVWAVTATLLASAVATPVVGRLGDMYGKRLMLLTSLAMLVAGSVIAALSDTLAPMIVGRALQGLAAGVIPLGISIMRDELPAERLGSATALMSASLGVGGALGLPAAALIADRYDWHMLFWTSAVLGLVAAVLVLSLVPESKVRTGGRFDLLGALGMAAGLVCLLLAISKGGDWGWTGGTTLGFFGAAVVVLLLWGLFELRSAQPLVDLRITVRRQVLVTNLASVAFGFSMFAMSLVLPQLLQLPEATGYGLGRSLLYAGLVMAPSGLVMMAVAPVSAAVSKAYGPKVTLMGGAVVVAVGYAVNIVLMDAVWQLVVASSVISAGIGLAYGAMPALIMAAVEPSATAAANSLNTLMRAIGTSTSSAVAGVILAQLTTRFGSAVLPSESAFKTVMAAGSGAAVLAFVVAAFIPRRAAAPVVGPDTVQATSPGGAPRPPAFPAEPVTVVAPDTAAPAADARGTEAVAAGPAGLSASAVGAGPGVPVRGQVRGAEGVPVAGAPVTLIGLDGRQLNRALAHSDGSYALAAPGEGTYILIASAAGCRPRAVSLVVGAAPLTYDILLGGGSGLAGAVRSADSGAPVADAVVVVTDVRGDVLATGRTDALGEFSVGDLVPGTVTLAVSSSKHRPSALPVDLAGAGVTRVEIELRPGAYVRGTVSGAGAPLGDARVTLLDAAGNVVATATTGADGAYAFSDLDTGPYSVVATGYPPRAVGVRVDGGDIEGHDIELGHPGV
ncbi:MFS transporter [Streptomyces sp. NPDC006012]|uniref:MFS transporter n=1 Tax=Streptomyces sp. NPDC006012 TaxID=3364739 RepID=UPI0036745692